MARTLPQLELVWKLLKAHSNSDSIPFPSHFLLSILFHCIPIPILTTCLRSSIAPKWVNWFLCGWCQSLSFLKFYMMHIKKEMKNRSRNGWVMGSLVSFSMRRSVFEQAFMPTPFIPFQCQPMHYDQLCRKRRRLKGDTHLITHLLRSLVGMSDTMVRRLKKRPLHYGIRPSHE